MKEYVEHQVKSKIETFIRGFMKIVLILIAIVALMLLFGYGFMLLWNWLMPDIFGLPGLTYWKAVGILVMAKLLFGGFEGKGMGKSNKNPKKNKSKKSDYSCEKDFSKWEFYDKFWAEEGEKAFDTYVERKQNENQ